MDFSYDYEDIFRKLAFSTVLAESNAFWGKAINNSLMRSPDDFPIAHVKAKYHGKTLCDFEKYDHMADLVVTSAKSWVTRKSAKQNLPFSGGFLLEQF